MKNRVILALTATAVALVIAAACSPAELQKIDPVSQPKTCPLQCGPTAGHPSGDLCCWSGSDGSGYACNSALDTSPDVCSFTGAGVGPADGSKRKPEPVPTKAPSPTEAPKEVLEVTHIGKG